MKKIFTCSGVFLVCLLLVSAAWGQWSSDPAVNLPLADKPNNDQVQPKLKALPNGGWYVSWFDSDPTTPKPVGYDPHIQHLDPGGVELFPHDGIRVADLSNSSTQDYGLDFDTSGNALITFLDTREGANEQVTVAKVDPTGKPLWGRNHGFQLTNDSSFHGAPKVTGTSDGGAVVGWINDSETILQKLDSGGHLLWGAGVVLSAPGFNYSLADLHASDNGSVIVSFVRDSGFGSNRQLLTNKLDSTGALLWGSQHVTIFDTGSLQFGNFPYFITDGNGGAVFGWYTSSPTLQVFAQHIRADGSEAFPHNGAAGSTNTSNVRVSPSVAYRAATDETFLFWTEEDSLQSKNGVSGQKFSHNGARKWGQTGLTIVPVGSNSQIFVTAVQAGSGALVYWVDEPSFTSSTIQATRLDGAGNTVCAQFPVATTPQQPFGLVAGIQHSGLSALAWSDDRVGNNSIYIQNVNKDCSLGQ